MTVLYTLLYISLFVLSLQLILINPLYFPVSWILAGIALHNLLYIAHDSAHGNMKYLGYILMSPFFVSFNGYKAWHHQHHITVGTGLDPELRIKELSADKYKPPINKFWIYIQDMFGAGCWELIALVEAINKDRWCQAISSGVLFWTLAILILQDYVYIVASMLFLTSFTTMYASIRLRSYWEHFGYDRIATGRSYNDPKTSTASAPWYIKFLTVSSVDKHAAHHENPKIPFWKL